jgi:aryl-alcohol dehydrogenase-like predicted oxidoreductase
VSVIGIGTWQFGGEWARDYAQSEVDELLDTAAEAGINLIDTAECYGDHLSERLIGDYLSRRDRSRWFVATKFGHKFNRFMDRTELFSTAEVQVQLEESLRALRAESINLYQFHSGSDALFQNESLWKMLSAQKAAGKIQHLGISILGKGSELQARQAHEVGAEVLQVIYNRLDQRPEQLYFPAAAKDKLGILARVPLASGLLGGKYAPGSTFPANDVRATFDPEKLKADLETIQSIQKNEVPPGVPMARWALAWCLRNPLVTAVIPGAKNSSQVRENAAAVQLLQS